MTRLASVLLLVALTQPAMAACTRRCASRPEGCGKGFGTLAYVVSTCRVVGRSQIGAQELRIHRAGCDSITVLRLANPEPVADPFGLCTIVGENHLGTASPIAGAFQRLGVTPDGKGVVFEINNAFELLEHTPLAPEQQGFFYVRADGTGLRRLGPPSRDPTYRIYVSGGRPSAEVQTRVAISEDGRWAVFSDRAPGADGVETEQLFAIDLVTGERRQVTNLTAGEPPRPGRRIIGYFAFQEGRPIVFVLETGRQAQAKKIRVDGTGLRDLSDPSGLSSNGENRVSLTFRRSGLRYGLVGITSLVPPVNADALPDFGTRVDLYSLLADGNLIQLTNFGFGDTNPLGLAPRDIVFMASADPLGKNPFHNCQLFRISPLGLGFRQATHFGQGRRSEEGCQIGPLPGCGIRELNGWDSDTAAALTFYYDCDPIGTDPNLSRIHISDPTRP
jgi:hypothetical protein